MSGVYTQLNPGTTVQTASPTTGQTVTATPGCRSLLLVLTPAGTLAALTITFPTDASTQVGDLFCFHSTQTVTTLTLNGATINNNVTALLPLDSRTFQKTGANTWSQVAGNV